MKTLIPGALAAMALLACPNARAEVLPSAGQVNPLDSVGISARAIGMGSAFVSVANDSSALFWNPGGLAGLAKDEAAFHHNAWLAGINQNTAVLGFSLGKRAGLGLSLNTIDYGPMEGYAENGSRLPDYSAGRWGAKIGLAGKFADLFSAGLSLNGNWQTLAGIHYSNFSGDVGLLVKAGHRLSFGIAVFDLGPTVAGSPLAATVRLGGAWRFEGHRHQCLLAISEAVALNGANTLQIGLEDRIVDRFVLRAGYQRSLADNHLSGLNGLSAGGGLVLRPFILDYAYLPFGDLGNTHRISVTYRFHDLQAPSIAPSLPPKIPMP